MTLHSCAINLLFPSRCVACGALSRSPLCPDCLARLPLILPPFCPRCGTPLSREEKSCRVCHDTRLEFSLCRSVLRFEGGGRDAIHALKYANERRVAPVLAALAAEHVQPSFLDVDVITFVPLRRKKQAERGYNQSELAARALARLLGARPAPLLRQVRPTADQAQLDARHRRANVRGAFDVRPAAAKRLATGRRVLLVDDVFTTGATAGECASVLARAGAAEVRVLTLARAPLC